MDDHEARALRERCTRFVGGHGREDASDLLAGIPADTEPDRYGSGGVVALELPEQAATKTMINPNTARIGA